MTAESPRRARRRLILGLAVLLIVLAYAAWFLFAYFNQESMLFPGAARTATAAIPPDARQIWITSDEGLRVEAWYRAGVGRTASTPGPAVIYFHGNNDLLETSWWAAPHYCEVGISILVVEYRGYGRSEGQPSQAALVADAIRFHDWLAAEPAVDPGRIIYHGTSLGGAVAAALTQHRLPAALILECTFTSMEAMAHHYLLPGFLCRHPFRTDLAIQKIDVPIAIFHGRHDGTIPVSHGRRLHELAPDSRYTELDCGHDNFHNDWANIRDFLAEVALLP